MSGPGIDASTNAPEPVEGCDYTDHVDPEPSDVNVDITLDELAKQVDSTPPMRVPPSIQARTIQRLQRAVRNKLGSGDVVPDFCVVGDEMSVRLRLRWGEESGYSWIDLAPLEGQDNRAIRWAAHEAVRRCVHDLSRYMLVIDDRRDVIQYHPQRKPEVIYTRRSAVVRGPASHRPV